MNDQLLYMARGFLLLWVTLMFAGCGLGRRLTLESLAARNIPHSQAARQTGEHVQARIAFEAQPHWKASYRWGKVPAEIIAFYGDHLAQRHWVKEAPGWRGYEDNVHVWTRGPNTRIELMFPHLEPSQPQGGGTDYEVKLIHFGFDHNLWEPVHTMFIFPLYHDYIDWEKPFLPELALFLDEVF